MTATAIDLTVRIGTIALVAGALTACTDQSQPDFRIDVRGEGGLVAGSDFTCTGNWPSQWTPCQDDKPATMASLDDLGILHLMLYSTANPDDGEGSVVYLDLTIGVAGQLDAQARETTFLMLNGSHSHETSAPTNGWIEPATITNNPMGRNSGRFSVTFQWGGISGAYDTSPP